MPKLNGNKGEWSEVYVFLRLLEIGKLYAADADLNKIDDVFYNIIHIIRTEGPDLLEFQINRSDGMVSVVKMGSVLVSLPFDDFKRAADHLYNEIVAASTSSFPVQETENLLDELSVHTLKAKSADKSDIKIKIHDIDTGIDSVQGFSIKSRLGSPSTLINAGKTTNFIYEVTGPVTDSVMNEFNTCSKSHNYCKNKHYR